MIGEIPESVLKALLETIPLEISVVDADDKVLAWNKHETDWKFQASRGSRGA